MNIDRNRPTSILECIGPAAMLEQMAEEAAELSKASDNGQLHGICSEFRFEAIL